MHERVSQPPLFTRNAAQLIVGVGFFRIDSHGLLEALNGYRVLAALLVNQPELVLRLGIVGVDGRSFQHPVEILAAAQAGTKVSELASEIVERVKQEKGRGEPAECRCERPPKEGGRGQRNRSEEHTSELQSHHDLVCRLLLEKKKTKTYSSSNNIYTSILVHQ